jgi:hypothetical protein
MESKKFALFPKKVTSGKTVWFTYYWEHRELWDRRTGRAPIMTFEFVWTETAQERTWRFIKESVIANRNVWNEPTLIKEDKL